MAVTRSLAIEYASRGLRVNALSLGVINNLANDPASYEGMADPVGRIGDIDDVAGAFSISSRPPLSPGRFCTSTAARPPDVERNPPDELE